MTSTPLQDLRDQIARHEAVIVVGAGVSMAATGGAPEASWIGLLRSGVENCRQLSAAPLKRIQLWEQMIQSSDLEDLLFVAEQISKTLKDRGEYQAWLRNTVGALNPAHREVLDALIASGTPIATTNYDSLVEQAAGWQPVIWQEADLRAWLDHSKEVVHLHGYWRRPDSVIFGMRSYTELGRADAAQEFQRALWLTRTLLFVGCGETFRDPNFDSWLSWARGTFPNMERRHYRLALNSEVERLQKDHAHDRVFVIGYGESHADMAPFLRALVSSPTDGAVVARDSASESAKAGADYINSQPGEELPDSLRTTGGKDDPRFPRIGRISLGILIVLLAGLLVYVGTKFSAGDAARKLVKARSGIAASSAEASTALIGISIWQLRDRVGTKAPEAPTAGTRNIVHPPQAADRLAGDWTPVKSPGFDLDKNALFYVSVESSFRGYLYLIQLEYDHSGGTGSPYLIFPTTRIRNAENRIEPGKVIALPDRNDRPNYWAFDIQGNDYAGEEVWVLVSPTKLNDVEIGPEPVSLNPHTFSDWRKRFAANDVTSHSAGSSLPITPAEAAAENDYGRSLTSLDPAPATVFSAQRRSSGAVMFPFRIRVSL